MKLAEWIKRNNSNTIKLVLYSNKHSKIEDKLNSKYLKLENYAGHSNKFIYPTNQTPT